MTNGQNAARARHLEDLATAAKRYTLREILDVTNAVATELENFTADDFTGAGVSAAGLSGMVPAPAAGEQSCFLRGDGSWVSFNLPDITLAGYSQVENMTGALSDEDNLLSAIAKIYNMIDGSWANVGLSEVTLAGMSEVANLTGALLDDDNVLAAIAKIYNKLDDAGGARYADFIGAGASTAGARGLVPAPSVGDNEKFLRGDGTWAIVSNGGSSAGALVLDTVPVTVDGGFWWEPEEGVPVLKLRQGNKVYSFHSDSQSSVGD